VRVLLIVNPTASRVTPATQHAIAEALGGRHDLEIADTSARDHATALAADAASREVDVVAVLAGDGTLNEAAQGLAGTHTALAPLPGGSTNVFARSLGVAYRPLDASTQLLASLDAGRLRRVGLGTAGHDDIARRFVFHLGVGFDAAIVREMEERHAHLKRHLAHPAFALATVDTWLRHYDRTTRIEIETVDVDGVRATTHGPYAVVSNADPYTYVGRRPVSIATDAGINRPLAVTTFSSLRLGVLTRAIAGGVLHAPSIAASPQITQVADVLEVDLRSDHGFPWQVDGDYLGITSDLTVRYEPDALTIVVP
jgi:diacylglycerol kinase family enzyme